MRCSALVTDEIISPVHTRSPSRVCRPLTRRSRARPPSPLRGEKDRARFDALFVDEGGNISVQSSVGPPETKSMTRRLLLTVLTVLAAGFAPPGSAASAAPAERSLDDYRNYVMTGRNQS